MADQDIILWERPIQYWADRYTESGDCILDVGTNTGGLACAFARIVGPSGKVHGFECNPKMFHHINRNKATYSIENLEIHEGAVHEQSGQILDFFLDDSPLAPGSSLAFQIPGAPSIKVETISLDDYCGRHRLAPSFIKIDVEGAELNVLKGGHKLLSLYRPVVVFEHFPKLGSSILYHLWQYGYVIYDANTCERIRKVPDSSFPMNFVALDPNQHALPVLDRRFVHEEAIIETKTLAQAIAPDDHEYRLAVNLVASAHCQTALNIHVDNEIVLHFRAGARHLTEPSCSMTPISLKAGSVLQVDVSDSDIAGSTTIEGLSLIKMDFV